MPNTADSPLGSASTAEQIQQQVEGVAEAAERCCSEWSERLRLYAEPAEDFIRKQPIKSLLIAAGVGLVIGLAIRR
jgi:ElaB/YqjD/DUF883 family membrane-anchored ribosome-binding protein